MHIVFRESHGLEEAETPQDLGQSPGEIAVLSFSDSDLGAFAAGWRGARARGLRLPSLRLANLARLRHPVSVDVYLEQTLSTAKAVLVRLIGGEGYWAYGLEGLRELASRTGLKLAVLPGDGRPDATLAGFSTVSAEALAALGRLCEAGGPEAALGALTLLGREAGLSAQDAPPPAALPECGIYHPATSIVAAFEPGGPPRVPVLFYRSYLAAWDMAAVDGLILALQDAGLDSLSLIHI